MGSKEEDVPTEPAEKPLFVEDMNESELASAVSKLRVDSAGMLTKRMYVVVESVLCSCCAYQLIYVYYRIYSHNLHTLIFKG
jgi:hypothetical protein